MSAKTPAVPGDGARRPRPPAGMAGGPPGRRSPGGRSIRRSVLVAGVAIAVLFGGSLAVISLLTGSSTSTVVPLDTPAASPAPAPRPSRSSGAPRVTRPAAGPNAPAPSQRPALSPRKVSRRVSQAIRRQLMSGEMASRLAACTGSARSQGGGATAVLLLDLEILGDTVRIVDAVPQREGLSSGGLDCAQKLLRGQVVPAPGGSPGSHMQMSFSVRL